MINNGIFWQNPKLGLNTNHNSYCLDFISFGTWYLLCGVFTQFNNNSLNKIIAINADGSLHTEFTNNIGSGFNDNVTRMIYKNNYIYCTGAFTSYNGTTQTRIIRLNLDGTRDSGFANNTSISAYSRGLAVDDDGKVYVTGDYNKLYCLNTDGTTAWSKNLNARGRRIFITSSTTGVVTGDFTTYDSVTSNRICGFNLSNGTRNTIFDAGFNGTCETGALSEDGGLWLAGNFSTYKGINSSKIIKIDKTNGNILFSDGVGLNNWVFDLSVFNNKVYVANYATSYRGTTITRGGLVINSDGTINTEYPANKAVTTDSYATGMWADKNGGIILTGTFVSYNGTTINYNTQLNNNGTIK